MGCGYSYSGTIGYPVWTLEMTIKSWSLITEIDVFAFVNYKDNELKV